MGLFDKKICNNCENRIAVIIAASLLLGIMLCGCTLTDPPLPPDTDPAEELYAQPSPTFAERLVGRYLHEGIENGETYLEIYHFDGSLIAEAEQEFAAYFAAELVPEDASVIQSPDAVSGTFFANAFSGFSSFGEYWEEKPKVSLTLTEYGLLITESDGTEVEFLRDDTRDPIHIADRYSELLSDVGDIWHPDEIIGTWTADLFGGYRIMLRLDGDGTLLYYCKKENEPAVIHIGTMAVSEDENGENGLLYVITERVGYAKMPFRFELEYRLTPTNILVIKNADSDGLLPTDDEVALEQ